MTTTDQNLGISVTIDAELERFEKNMTRAGRVVESSTTDMDRATKRAGQQFANLEGKLNPTARAANRLSRDTEKVQRALDKGAVSSQRAAKLQRQLNDQYEQAIARTRQLNTATDQMNATARRSSGGMSRFGNSAQNASFQIADFATQVSSGQSATRALGQQLPQLIGGFGPLAAAIGAVVSVGAALAPTLLNIGDESEKTEGKTKSYGQSLKAVNEIVDRANDASKTRAQRLRDEGNAALEGARAEVEAAQAKLEAFKEGASVSGASSFLSDLFGLENRSTEALNPRDARAREQRLENLNDQAEEAQANFKKLKDRLDKATDSLNSNTDAANDNADAVRDRIAEIAREADTNMRLADALQVSEERYEEVQRRIEAENIARDLGISIKDEEFQRIQKLVRARERESDRLEEARRKMRDVEDATNDATGASRDFGIEAKSTAEIAVAATEDAGRTIQERLAA